MSDDDIGHLSYRDRLGLRIIRALIELSKPKAVPSRSRRRLPAAAVDAEIGTGAAPIISSGVRCFRIPGQRGHGHEAGAPAMTGRLFITIGGQRIPFSGSPEQLAKLMRGRRAMNGKRLAALMRARRAAGQEKIEAASRYMSLLNSQDRIGKLVDLIEHAPAEMFWPIFAESWPNCDRTFGFNERLVDALRRVGPHPETPPQPERLTVYRGASRARIAAVSWTTDPEVARRFAAGHRGIRMPDPVIAMAEIGGDEVFWTTDERSESEIICVPRTWTIFETACPPAIRYARRPCWPFANRSGSSPPTAARPTRSSTPYLPTSSPGPRWKEMTDERRQSITTKRQSHRTRACTSP
jgi:hypothetical protein